MYNKNTKALLLLVDGAAAHLDQLSQLLQDEYAIRVADAAGMALHQAQQLPRPDLVLVDSALDGDAVCRRLKHNPDTAAIPVIMMLAQGDAAQVQQAFAAGAADVLERPLVAEAVRARIACQVSLIRARGQIAHQRRQLQELGQMGDAAAWTMAAMAEQRDGLGANHLHRVQHYVLALARRLQGHPRFAHELVEPHLALLFRAAPLHDIGKALVPDAILRKPGRLTPEEFDTMKLHTVYGRDAVAAVEKNLGYSNTYLRFAREIAYSHQEKFDGSGYPQGLRGDAIPVSARLMTVADVYDALISQRVYKPAFTHETAIELIRQGSGEHFDPDVVDALLAIEDEVREIALRYADATA